MLSNPIRIAIAGGGGAGIAQLRYFRSIPGTEVVLLHDPDPAAVKARIAHRNLPDVPLTDNFDHILERRDIDLVSVCTPDNTHAEYVVAAFKAGKHVLCEKPLASTMEHCNRILEAWRASGKVGAVQHQFRFEPWFSKAAEICRSGKLGSIFSVRGEYVHNLIHRSRENHPWRFDHADAHPAMIGAGVHFLDLFRYLTGAEIATISAISNHIAFPDYPDDDCVETIFTFTNGVVGSLTVAIGVNHPIHFPIRVFGTNASLANGWLVSERTADYVCSDGAVRGNMVKRLIHSARSAVRAWRGQEVSYNTKAVATYDHESACIGSLVNVIEAIRSGVQPLVSMEEGARACQIARAALIAQRERRTVEVPALLC